MGLPVLLTPRGGAGPPTLQPPGPAWGLWLLQEGAGQTLADASSNGRDMRLGLTDNTETSDPAWTVFNGVGCLEFAGAQICTPKFSPSLAQPFTILTLCRGTTFSGYRYAVHVASGGEHRGLFWDGHLAHHYGNYIIGVSTPGNTWIVPYSIANGASSLLGHYGGGSLEGNAGTIGISTVNFGARLLGGSIVNGFLGNIAAVAIVPSALDAAGREAWAQYLAAVKGVTL